jgi:hypothetical protein
LRMSVRPSLVMIPVGFRVPGMISAVPPLMISVPAVLPFGTEIMPAVAGLGAFLAVLGYCIAEPGFGLLDTYSALISLVCVRRRCLRLGTGMHSLL